MNSWTHATAERDADFDNYIDILAEPPVPPKKPEIETKLVDIATEMETPKTYIPEAKEEKEPVNMNAPVDIYEPGFRSDMAEAMIKFFKEKRALKDKLDKIREKTGIGR